MANGLDFSSGMARVARDGLDGAVIDGTQPVAYPFVPEDAAGIDANPDEVRTIDVSGGEYVIGSQATDLADAADDEPLPLFEAGILVEEAYARPALDALVSDLLANGMGNRLCYTIPGTLVDTETATERHREAVDEAVSSLGYDATPVSTGYAIVADQLKDENFTGLGINIDHAVTSVALVYYGVPVIVFSLPYGGDWIVEQAAADIGYDESEVATTLEEFTLDPDAANESVESALAQTYDDLCASLVTALRREAEAAEIERGLTVPVALAGSAAVDGVEYLFGGRFDAADLPFSVRGVRRASDPEESAVRGALIAAQEDVDAYEEVTWSAHEGLEASGSGSFGDDTATGEAADLQIDPPTDDDVADGAIEELFDRLGTRDDELDELRSDVTELLETLDTLRTNLDELEATSATTEDLDNAVSRLDDLGSTLQDVEETLSTVATADRVDSLASDLDELDGTVEAIAERVETVDADRETDRTDLQSSIESVESDLEAVEDQVETELEALESTVDQLDEKLDDTTETIATRIDDDISTLETAIDDLERDLTGEADDIQETLQTVESDVDALETSVESIDSTVDGLETTVERLESDVDHVAAAVESNESAIGAIEPTVAANEAAIESVDSTVETIAADVESLQETVDSIDGSSRDEQLREEFEAVQKSVSTLEDDLETIADELETVREQHGRRLDEQAALVTDLTGSADRIDSLESAVADLETDVDAATSDTAETPDETSLTAVESTLTETRETQETLEGRVSELEAKEQESIPEKPLERIAELDQQVHELTERLETRVPNDTDDQSDETPTAGSETAAAGTGLGTFLAGGASAAIVTGATVAATGPIEIAAGLMAVGAIGTGAVLLRR